MSGREFLAIGIAVWGAVFVLLLVALAVEADVEKRWHEDWALEWERVRGKPIDELIESLAGQLSVWRTSRSLLTWYLLLSIAAAGVIVFVQWQHELMLPATFERAMLIAASVVGLLMLPARVISEIGLGIVEGMHRQARAAAGERIVINSKEEIDAWPRPEKPAKKPTAPAGEAPAPR